MKNMKIVTILGIFGAIVLLLIFVNYKISKEVHLIVDVPKEEMPLNQNNESGVQQRSVEQNTEKGVITIDSSLLDPVNLAVKPAPAKESSQNAADVSSSEIIYEIPLEETNLLQ